MSTYEDIGLSYVDFDTTSKYGTITLANPIGTTESFFLAVKFRSFNGAVNTRIISVGASTTTVISAYCHSTTTIYLKRVCASGEDVSTANGFGASYGNDGEDHIAVLHITPTQQKIYLDSLSNVGSDSSLVGSLTEALTKITINSRVTSTTPDQIGKSRIYWAALYSALPDADITSLMSGAAPNTVGTLRSGDSFWAFNGSSAEYNGGTPFTMVGSPTFVQPAYNNKLAVTDSYLSFDSTQYAQVTLSTPIAPTDSVWWARKFRITGGTSDPYLSVLGAVVSGSSAARIAWFNSTGKESIMRINNASSVGEYANTVVNDGQDHIIVLNIKPSWVDIWIDGAVKITGITGTALAYAMNMLTINALWNGTAASRKGSQRVYWEYLYNTLSPADITALMQGEHPASVGNIRQGYNLAGDGNEVNGGPALTLYNSPKFVVPNRIGLTRPLTSRLTSTLTSSLVSR